MVSTGSLFKTWKNLISDPVLEEEKIFQEILSCFLCFCEEPDLSYLKYLVACVFSIKSFGSSFYWYGLSIQMVWILDFSWYDVFLLWIFEAFFNVYIRKSEKGCSERISGGYQVQPSLLSRAVTSIMSDQLVVFSSWVLKSPVLVLKTSTCSTAILCREVCPNNKWWLGMDISNLLHYLVQLGFCCCHLCCSLSDSCSLLVGDLFIFAYLSPGYLNIQCNLLMSWLL